MHAFKDKGKRREKQLHSILSSMDDLVFVLNEHKRFTACYCPDSSKLYMAPDQFLGKTHGQVLPKRLTPLFEHAFRENRKGKVAEYEYTLELDGKLTCWHVKLAPIFSGKKFTGSVAVTRDTTDRMKTAIQLKRLASQLELTEERERKRFAEDIHDSIGHNLAVSHLKLNGMLKEDLPPRAEAIVKQVCGILAESVARLRSVIFDLSPAVLYHVGLEAALEELMIQARSVYGLKTRFKNDDRQKPITDDVRSLLFRTVRELVHNAVKHSKAKNASVSISRHNGHIRLVFENDGTGFDSKRSRQEANQGFGLFNLEERVNSLGGHFDIEPAKQSGVRITVSVPLATATSTTRTD